MSRSLFSWRSPEGKKQTAFKLSLSSPSSKSGLDLKREDSVTTIDTIDTTGHSADDGDDDEEEGSDWWMCPEGVNRSPFSPRPKNLQPLEQSVTKKSSSSMFSPSRAAKALLSSVGMWDKSKGVHHKGTTDHHPVRSSLPSRQVSTHYLSPAHGFMTPFSPSRTPSNSPQRDRRHENHPPPIMMLSPSKGPSALSYYQKKSVVELALITASLARHRAAAGNESGKQTSGVLSLTIPSQSALLHNQKKSSAELAPVTTNGNHANIQPPASVPSIPASQPTHQPTALPSSTLPTSSPVSTLDNPLVLDFTPSVQLDLFNALTARSTIPRTPCNSPHRCSDTMVEKVEQKPSHQLSSLLLPGGQGVPSAGRVRSSGLLESLQTSLQRREQVPRTPCNSPQRGILTPQKR